MGLLVAAAGFGTSGLFLDAPLDEEMDMLNVNCRSLLALSWYFGQRFAKRGRGGMVLMSSMLYIGISLLFNSLWALLLLLPLLLVVQIGVIQHEEVYLERKFGDEYLRYKVQVRRWI